MINTYHTSLAPPPVPPRETSSRPVLIPAPLPKQGHSKSLIRFLVGVALLHLFMSIGGFLYLLTERNVQIRTFPADGKAAALSARPREASYEASARMVVDPQSRQTASDSKSGYLKWTLNHSNCTNVSCHRKSWLTILMPGDYLVYSRVTFSRGDPQKPLAIRVKLKASDTGEEKVVMRAYCHLGSQDGGKVLGLCTASQDELIRLEKGNQLSVWVQDLTLVDYEDGATAFGMYCTNCRTAA